MSYIRLKIYVLSNTKKKIYTTKLKGNCERNLIMEIKVQVFKKLQKSTSEFPVTFDLKQFTKRL